MALELRAKLGHPPPGYIMVKMDKLEKEEVSKGGIIIAQDTANRQYAQSAVSTGIIFEVGAACWDGGEAWIEVGDRIWFEKYQGQEYKSGDDTFRTMPYYSIRMILRKDEF